MTDREARKDIEDAITEHWGESCPDFDANCPLCKIWAEWFALIRKDAQIERLREALERHHQWHEDVTGLYLEWEDEHGELQRGDISAEYADSTMREQTIAALKETQS